MNDAIAQYDEALRLKPDFAEAHDNLGNILAKMPGRSEDAIAQFEEALREAGFCRGAITIWATHWGGYRAGWRTRSRSLKWRFA